MSLEALRAYSERQKTELGVSTGGNAKNAENASLVAHMSLEERRRDLHRRMAENIKKSELLRSKINKDLNADTDHKAVLMDALECISLMTGDVSFYENNKKKLEKRP